MPGVSESAMRDATASEWQLDKAWGVQCALLLLPFSAILHHAVFYPHNCMLNPFGSDYTPAVVSSFLLRDPSLPWAMVLAGSSYRAGMHARLAGWLRPFALPFFFGFLPLSIWLWDIPFAGRPICTNWHDGQLSLPITGPLRSLHVYLLSALLTGVFTALRVLRGPSARAQLRVPSHTAS